MAAKKTTPNYTFEFRISFVMPVKRCARCCRDHEAVAFHAFAIAPKPYTHFAICPITQQPILMKILPDKVVKKRFSKDAKRYAAEKAKRHAR